MPSLRILLAEHRDIVLVKCDVGSPPRETTGEREPSSAGSHPHIGRSGSFGGPMSYLYAMSDNARSYGPRIQNCNAAFLAARAVVEKCGFLGVYGVLRWDYGCATVGLYTLSPSS